jgi:hypothetical protein
MKKIMNIAAIATILLAFAACQKDSTSVSNSGQDETTMKKQPVTKNFKINNSSGVFEYSYNSECGPSYTQASIIGSGTATHIGNFDTEASFCVDENGSATSDINGTFTAANGDQIIYYMSDPSAGIYFDEEGLMHMEFDIVGGTGRFDGATGYYSLVGTVDFVNFTWSWIGNGSITY